jgi:hypothetical protein
MKRTCVRFLGPDEILAEPLKAALAARGVPLVDDTRDAEIVVTAGPDGTLSALEDCRGMVIQMCFDRRDLVTHKRVVHHDFIQPTDALIRRLE